MTQLGGMFGGSSPEDTTASIDSSVLPQERSLAMAANEMAPAVQAGGAGSCPRISIWQNDSQLTVFQIGRVGDNLAIRHRGEITKTARECKIEDGKVTVKYGFAGQVLLGPKGKSGVVSLPVKIYVTDGQREKINSEIVNVSVNIPPENRIGYFSLVRSITIRVPQGARAGDYKLFVAFDRIQKSG